MKDNDGLIVISSSAFTVQDETEYITERASDDESSHPDFYKAILENCNVCIKLANAQKK